MFLSIFESPYGQLSFDVQLSMALITLNLGHFWPFLANQDQFWPISANVFIDSGIFLIVSFRLMCNLHMTLETLNFGQFWPFWPILANQGHFWPILILKLISQVISFILMCHTSSSKHYYVIDKKPGKMFPGPGFRIPGFLSGSSRYGQISKLRGSF